MIVITLTQALILYTLILGCGFFVLLLYAELKVERTAERLEKQHLWRCVICAYTYLDTPGTESSTCPRCHSVNTLDDKKAKLVPVKSHRKKEAMKEELVKDVETASSHKKRRRGGRRGHGSRRH